MAAAAVNDLWQEVCKISISKIGSATELIADGQTETVDFDIADKDFESVPLVNGGRVVKWNPQEDSTFTFEAYPMEAGTDTGTTLKGWDDLMNDTDATVPIRIINTRVRNKYRVIVLWTNDPTVTTATQITTNTYSALRIGGADGYFTSIKKSFTDSGLKYTCIYKVPAFDKTGSGCLLHESCAGSTAQDILPAIAAYTTTNKFG